MSIMAIMTLQELKLSSRDNRNQGLESDQATKDNPKFTKTRLHEVILIQCSRDPFLAFLDFFLFCFVIKNIIFIFKFC